MKPHQRRVLGFSVPELVVVVVIIALVVFLGMRLFSSGTKTVAGTTAGGWSIAPGTIPAAPATGSFTYHVAHTPPGGTPAALPGRAIKFTLGPSTLKYSTGHIVSITDKTGTAVTINAMTGSGETDLTGDIVVVVTLESKESGNIVATDVKTGVDDPPIVLSAQ